MKTQEIAIKGKSKIDVTLSDDAKALDEVVVIGYGTAKRKDITGSVASVNSETLAAIPVASATEALQGKMAGVQITTTEGSPDAQMSIRVRGGGSITQSNEPVSYTHLRLYSTPFTRYVVIARALSISNSRR